MEAGGVNLSPQETIVVTTALIGAAGNGYLFVAAVHDGHRGLYHAAAVAFFIFSLVAGVFFWRAMSAGQPVAGFVHGVSPRPWGLRRPSLFVSVLTHLRKESQASDNRRKT